MTTATAAIAHELTRMSPMVCRSASFSAISRLRSLFSFPCRSPPASLRRGRLPFPSTAPACAPSPPRPDKRLRRVSGFLAASAHARNPAQRKRRQRRAHRRGRSRDKDSPRAPFHGQEHAADQRPDDRTHTPDSKRPADARCPDRGRIERGSQPVRCDLAADNAEPGGEDCHGHQDDRMTDLADCTDREHRDEIHQRQRAEREAVDDAAERERADDAADLQHRSDRRRRR